MSEYYVYQHVDPRTNLVRYVGKGKDRRAWKMSCRHAHQKNWITQLKSNGLTPIVEIIEKNLTEKQAFDLEKLWITAYRHEGIPLTNLTDGGDGTSGHKWTDSQRENIPKKNKGKIRSKEHCELMSKIKKGHRCSPKTEFKKGLVPWNQGKKGGTSAMKGRKHSLEVLHKMSVSKKGQVSPFKDKHFSLDSKIKVARSKSKQSTKAVNIRSGEEFTFDSIFEAALFTKSSRSGVRLVCKGNRNSCNGWIFSFTEKVGG